MPIRLSICLLLMLVAPLGFTNQPFEPDAAKSCFNCDEWNLPQKPFQIFGNTYYVGTAGLTAVLIVSNDGLILIDGGLSQSAALIDANIRTLGFSTQDIKLILNSHAHYDHAGGLASLQRASQAPVMVSPESSIALLRGGPTEDDPQYDFGEQANSFPAVNNVQVIQDRMAVQVGDVQLIPYFTPGHTTGSTTWTWTSCQQNQCLDIVYADSINPVSAPSFQFFAATAKYDYTTAFNNNIKIISSLDCDILLSPHPFYFDMKSKLVHRQATEKPNPFIDPLACRQYAQDGSERLKQRIQTELAQHTDVEGS